MITAVRLGLVPLLVVLVDTGITFYSATLFLFLLFTDFLDGYMARKFGVTSKLGTFFDVTADFVLVFSVLLVFGSRGFYADWVPILVVTMFVWFVSTSLYSRRIYDPVGKYYGSFLYGLMGLRFMFSGQVLYSVVTIGIVGFSVASIVSRAIFVRKKLAR